MDRKWVVGAVVGLSCVVALGVCGCKKKAVVSAPQDQVQTDATQNQQTYQQTGNAPWDGAIQPGNSMAQNNANVTRGGGTAQGNGATTPLSQTQARDGSLSAKPIGDAPAPQVHPAGTYTVKSTDTLSSIAKEMYGSASKWQVIHEANKDKISDANHLKVGTVLTIPALKTEVAKRPDVKKATDSAKPAAGNTHTVAAGESFSTLAAQYLGSANRWQELWRANRDKAPNPDVLKPGTVLVIPAVTKAAESPAHKSVTPLVIPTQSTQAKAVPVAAIP